MQELSLRHAVSLLSYLTVPVSLRRFLRIKASKLWAHFSHTLSSVPRRRSRSNRRSRCEDAATAQRAARFAVGEFRGQSRICPSCKVGVVCFIVRVGGCCVRGVVCAPCQRATRRSQVFREGRWHHDAAICWSLSGMRGEGTASGEGVCTLPAVHDFIPEALGLGGGEGMMDGRQTKKERG